MAIYNLQAHALPPLYIYIYIYYSVRRCICLGLQYNTLLPTRVYQQPADGPYFPFTSKHCIWCCLHTYIHAIHEYMVSHHTAAKPRSASAQAKSVLWVCEHHYKASHVSSCLTKAFTCRERGLDFLLKTQPGQQRHAKHAWAVTFCLVYRFSIWDPSCRSR